MFKNRHPYGLLQTIWNNCYNEGAIRKGKNGFSDNQSQGQNLRLDLGVLERRISQGKYTGEIRIEVVKLFTEEWLSWAVVPRKLSLLILNPIQLGKGC